jgi:nucleotide-binding universal stress UspA family protein
MKTLVVATDGSAGSTRAGRWARAMAPVLGADVTVTTVPASGAPNVLAEADRVDAALVVVAAHPWSVADYLAHHSRRPFAVVPASSVYRPPSRIAVGDDGSAGADEAARWSTAVAAASGAEIVAIDVVHPPEFLTPFLSELHDDAVHELEEHWAAPPRHAATPDVVDDDRPARALLREVERSGADLLVLGARALCGVRLLPRDGVTLTALHDARVPIVVVPAATAIVTTRDGGSEEGYSAQRVLT